MNTRELIPKASGSFGQLLTAAKGCLRLIKHGRPFRLIGLSIVSLGLLGSTMALHSCRATIVAQQPLARLSSGRSGGSWGAPRLMIWPPRAIG